MRIPGFKRLRLSARWFRSQFVDGALILGYHRIAESNADPFSLCVTPKHFSEHLAVIRKHARPMSLLKLVDSLKTGKVPRRAVVITFDDGYAENLYVAKPLLERHDIPATVFVTTGYLGGRFWWEELAAIVLNAKALPEQFCVRINGKEYEWKSQRGQDIETVSRRRLLSSLQQAFQSLSYNERQQAMEQLRTNAGESIAAYASPMALSPEEVLRLAKGNLFEIGAHSVSHPILSTLTLPAQKFEILQSKTDLEKLLGQAVSSFSYPHGALSKATVATVQQTGYLCACTSLNDVVWGRTHCFQLPRFWPGDWDGVFFGRWLRRWLNS